MQKRMMTGVLLLALVFLSVTGPVWAGTGSVAETDTGGLVVAKLFRGIVNAATGWMEIPKQMSLIWQEKGPGSGLTWGFIKGIGFAVARSVAGGYEIATFPVPVPEGYRPIMQPEYVLSDFGQSNK